MPLNKNAKLKQLDDEDDLEKLKHSEAAAVSPWVMLTPDLIKSPNDSK